MLALSQRPCGEVFMWRRDGDVGTVVHCSLQGRDVVRHSPSKSLAYEFRDVDVGNIAWTGICFIPFLLVSAQAIEHVIAVSPHIFRLASACARHRRGSVKAEGPVAEYAGSPRAPRGEFIDVSTWLPSAEEVYYPKTIECCSRAPERGDHHQHQAQPNTN